MEVARTLDQIIGNAQSNLKAHMPKMGKTIVGCHHEGHSKHIIAVLQILMGQYNS